MVSLKFSNPHCTTKNASDEMLENKALKAFFAGEQKGESPHFQGYYRGSDVVNYIY